MNEKSLREINETLKKIENKMEDKSSPFTYNRFFDYAKSQEESRKKREDERNEEILKIHKIQTDSIKKQEKFTEVVAFTGSIIALVAIYNFIIQSVNLEASSISYWAITVIFLVLGVMCLGPLISIIFNFWKKEALGR